MASDVQNTTILYLMVPDSSQGCCETSARLPCTETLPASSRGSPIMPDMRVLLPLPAAPLTTTKAPRGTCSMKEGGHAPLMCHMCHMPHEPHQNVNVVALRHEKHSQREYDENWAQGSPPDPLFPGRRPLQRATLHRIYVTRCPISCAT